MNPIDKTIIVRKMEDTDITSVIAIDKEISTHYRPDTWKTELQHYLSKPESICLVAEIQGSVVGFMIGAVHPWLFGVENGGWIEILGVHPSYTGKGIGKQLGIKLLDDFKARKINVVHTAVEWTASDLLEFFKTLGMTKSGLITLKKKL